MMCPNRKCGGYPNQHVGGTCYGQCKMQHSHYCGWVHLGPGNKWRVDPGWYNGLKLNQIAESLPPDQRPQAAFF